MKRFFRKAYEYAPLTLLAALMLGMWSYSALPSNPAIVGMAISGFLAFTLIAGFAGKVINKLSQTRFGSE
jgi:hypothetical protein